MREIITTTGASLFTAGVLIAQAIAAPPPAALALLTPHATIAVAAR